MASYEKGNTGQENPAQSEKSLVTSPSAQSAAPSISPSSPSIEEAYDADKAAEQNLLAVAREHCHPCSTEWLTRFSMAFDALGRSRVAFVVAVSHQSQARITALEQDEARADQWLPIESAPKDGRPVLAYDDGAIMIASYVESDTDDEPSGWYDHGIMDPPPTHWMPLPSPPRTGGVPDVSST